jgi:hypothetical protein
MNKETLKRKLIDIRNGAMITPLLEELTENNKMTKKQKSHLRVWLSARDLAKAINDKQQKFSEDEWIKSLEEILKDK